VLFGFSPFVGVLGFEYQENHHSFGIGLPGNISYRYFFKPYQDTKFMGVYAGGYSVQDVNRSYKGVNYSDVDSKL